MVLYRYIFSPFSQVRNVHIQYCHKIQQKLKWKTTMKIYQQHQKHKKQPNIDKNYSKSIQITYPIQHPKFLSDCLTGPTGDVTLEKTSTQFDFSLVPTSCLDLPLKEKHVTTATIGKLSGPEIMEGLAADDFSFFQREMICEVPCFPKGDDFLRFQCFNHVCFCFEEIEPTFSL